MWMFAALSSVEPPILDLQTAKFAEADRSWAGRSHAAGPGAASVRSSASSPIASAARTGSMGRSARAISMMVHTLAELLPSGLLDQYPSLAAYVARGQATTGLPAGPAGGR